MESEKRGRIWICPREDRGNYKQRKKFPFPVEVLADIALKSPHSLFLNGEILLWLNHNFDNSEFGYSIGLEFVTFRFKNEQSVNKFTKFLNEGY